MPKKEYGWANGTIPEIAPHSLAKHRILGEYVGRYVRFLTANPRVERLRLSLIDGFAGGGEYRHRGSGLCVPGSPQILMDAVRDAEIAANVSRHKKVHIEATFYFVEKDPKTAAYLENVLSRRPQWELERKRVTVLRGTFEGNVERVLGAVSSSSGGRVHRAIFVLDQYGYTGVPVSLIARIFKALPRAEVFLTVAVGWITAYLRTIREVADKLV